ncbi:DUF551 domain-containing protein [Dysosmobacter sp.]|uniref:DUF551 domain-containing protein n=1 Tax=Dysosmobacter sp. TaxID=2591382 RepID=UPI003AF747EB
MRDQELVNAIRRLKVETGSLACMGCGHEHNCGVSGCAVMRAAADRIANQNTNIEALQQEIEKLRGQVPRWIPVAERLPSGDNQVLVVVSGKPKENITLAGAVELATLYSDGWCLETWPEWTGAEVTHWMPIPETPEPPEEAGHD